MTTELLNPNTFRSDTPIAPVSDQKVLELHQNK